MLSLDKVMKGSEKLEPPILATNSRKQFSVPSDAERLSGWLLRKRPPGRHADYDYAVPFGLIVTHRIASRPSTMAALGGCNTASSAHMATQGSILPELKASTVVSNMASPESPERLTMCGQRHGLR